MNRFWFVCSPKVLTLPPADALHGGSVRRRHRGVNLPARARDHSWGPQWGELSIPTVTVLCSVYLPKANILIDSDDRARLTGFTLAKIASITRYAQPVDNTVPWKSPELLFPVKFGLSKGHPTKESDYYALGMVIYEVLSGQRPFAFVTDCDLQVAPMVFGGERPLRPRGAEGKWFTNEIWEVLEQCWQQQPGDRLGAKGVLAALQRIPPPPGTSSRFGLEHILLIFVAL